MIPADELIALFLNLASIEGVSLSERKVADNVTARLVREGIKVLEDDSAKTFGGNTGNLICFPPGYRQGEPALMLTSHMDTVKSTAALKPIIDATSIRSDGTTILGADNRMGLSVLVRLLTDAARSPSSFGNFFVLFTVGEETGLFGAATVNVSPYHPCCAYVFDCSKRPGAYIHESVGLSTFTAQFIGKSAHSGIAPEEGVSAIQLGAKAIAQLQLGRIDPDTTANIGTIQGGEAINAIPEKVSIEGEVRSFTLDQINSRLHLIEKTMCESVAGTGQLVFSAKQDFQPYILSHRAPVVLRLEQAMRAVGLQPMPIRYTGGSDANKYNAKGIPAVNIGIGAQKPHSSQEFLLIDDLLKTYELAAEIVRAQK